MFVPLQQILQKLFVILAHPGEQWMYNSDILVFFDAVVCLWWETMNVVVKR